MVCPTQEYAMEALVAVTVGCFTGPALIWMLLKLPDIGEWIADKWVGPSAQLK